MSDSEVAKESSKAIFTLLLLFQFDNGEEMDRGG